MKLRKIYQQIAPEKVKRIMDPIYAKYFHEYKEERRTFGKRNPDKMFYVIRNVTQYQSVLNNWIEVARKIDYARQKGYIPIVDFLNYPRPGLSIPDNDGKVNVWELFFKQPVPGYTLEEVYDSKNVIISFGQDLGWLESWPTYKDVELCMHYHSIYEECASFTLELLNKMENEKKKYFQEGDRVVGISMRRELEQGALLKIPLYVDNPLHAPKNTLEQVKNDIDNYMREFKCNKFFFACDDEEGCEIIKKEFGNKAIIYARKRMRYFQNGVPRPREIIKAECVDDRDKITREYLTETYLLAQCTSLVGIATSSNTMACIINNYSYEHVI